MKSVYLSLLLSISVFTHQFATAQASSPIASPQVIECLKPLLQQGPPTMNHATAVVQSLGVLYKTTFQGDKNIYELAVAINELFKKEAELKNADNQIEAAETLAQKKEAAANHALTVGSSLTGPQPRQAAIYLADARKIREQAKTMRETAKQALLEKIKAVDRMAGANQASGNNAVALALSASLYAVLDRNSPDDSFSPSVTREWVNSERLKPNFKNKTTPTNFVADSATPNIKFTTISNDTDAEKHLLQCPLSYVFRDEIDLRIAVVEAALTKQASALSNENIRKVISRNIIDLNGSPLIKEVIAVDKIASNLSPSQLESIVFKDGTSLMHAIKHDLNFAIQSGQISLLKPILKKLEEDILPNPIFDNFASAIYSTRRNLSPDDIIEPGNLVHRCLAGSFNGQDLRQTVCKRLFNEKNKDFPVSFKSAIANEFGLIELLSKLVTIRDATRRESVLKVLREANIKMTEDEISNTASIMAIWLGGSLADRNFLRTFGFQTMEDADVEFILSSQFGITELNKLRKEFFDSMQSR